MCPTSWAMSMLSSTPQFVMLVVPPSPAVAPWPTVLGSCAVIVWCSPLSTTSISTLIGYSFSVVTPCFFQKRLHPAHAMLTLEHQTFMAGTLPVPHGMLGILSRIRTMRSLCVTFIANFALMVKVPFQAGGPPLMISSIDWLTSRTFCDEIV